MELILVDTSIWVDHLNHPQPVLAELMFVERTLLHPFVLGEIGLGNLPDWNKRLKLLRQLPGIEPIGSREFMGQIVALNLQGSGLGFVDAHLLASTLAAPERKLWSRDRRLRAKAEALGVAWSPA